jgi:hypothetical protein
LSIVKNAIIGGNKSLSKDQQVAEIKSQVSDMINGLNLYINTFKEFVKEKDETCDNSDKTMKANVSDMNGMQDEISTLSEILFGKDLHILDFQAKIKKLEEYKETAEGLKLSGKALLDENKASEEEEEDYCKSIEELKKHKEKSKQIILKGQDQEPYPINCWVFFGQRNIKLMQWKF